MERDILADVNHPFIVKLNYGMFIRLDTQLFAVISIFIVISCLFSIIVMDVNPDCIRCRNIANHGPWHLLAVVYSPPISRRDV